MKLKGEIGKEEPNLILFISASNTTFSVVIIIIKNSAIICSALLAQRLDC